MLTGKKVVAGTVISILAVVFLASASAEDSSKAEYVGAKRCKACHSKQHSSWSNTRMAKSFELLQPNASAEARKAAGLDPAKDYTRDATCLPCHTTGYGQPGGYEIPGDDEASKAMAAKREGAQCESCHGPGSLYIPLMKEIMKTKRSYKNEAFEALGLTIPKKDTCQKCHNSKSPFVGEGHQFDFEKRKEQGTHVHLPLKYRE